MKSLLARFKIIILKITFSGSSHFGDYGESKLYQTKYARAKNFVSLLFLPHPFDLCLSAFSQAYAGNAFALTQDVLKAISEHPEFYNAGNSIHKIKFLNKNSSHVTEGTYKIHFGRYDMPEYKRCVYVEVKDARILGVTNCDD